MRWLSRVGAFRIGSALCIALAGLLYAGAAGASSASCGGSGAPSPNVGSGNNILNGVAATSACNAWAVGYYNAATEQTLVERWNGKAWKVQKSPNPGGSANYNELFGVAAVSASDAWAVGYYYNGTAVRTLVEHWNGKAWKVQKSPNPGGSAGEDELYGVAAVSSSDAWAVGNYYNGTNHQTLVEHWNGKAWKVIKSPNPGGSTNYNELYGLAAPSSTDVWAVGRYYNGTDQRTLVEHWNGKAWGVQKSPNPSNYDEFNAVSAVSSTDVWAAGEADSHGAETTLVAHWNGKAWKAQKSPNPSTFDNEFYGVGALSSSDAWAVGYHYSGTADQTLIAHWNGKAWKMQKSPNPGGATNPHELLGVAALSPNDIWAVGYYSNGTAYQTLVERWNGKAWKG